MILMFNQIEEHKNNNLTQGYEDDFGFDIRAGESGMIAPRCCSGLIHTGLHVCIPTMLGSHIKARGNQIKQDVMSDGTIDAGYPGEIALKLYNFSNSTPYRWEKGDRIAQMVFYIRPKEFFNLKQPMWELFPDGFKIIESESMDSWPKSARGDRRFASSGVR